jgi:glycosyltransferase involved in cell wall biosynthesis
MPSTTETQGLVIAEALAAGATVIAADTPQNRDVLGLAGRVVPPAPKAFAAALRAIPKVPDAAASAVARQAAERFRIEAQIDRMIALYEELMAAANLPLTANVRSP